MLTWQVLFVNRKIYGNQKGVMAMLMDHFINISPIAPQKRSFSGEFLDHQSGCAPYNNKVTAFTQSVFFIAN